MTYLPVMWRPRLLVSLSVLLVLSADLVRAQLYSFPINNSAEEYFENFSTVSTWSGIGTDLSSPSRFWTRGFTAVGSPLSPFETPFEPVPTVATNTAIYRGSNNLILQLATNSPNTSPAGAAAVDLALEFSNRRAGTLTFDWAKVTNGAANARTADLAVQIRSGPGADFSNMTGYTIPRITNNSTPQSGTISVQLPSWADSTNTTPRQAIIRFYVWDNGQTTTGVRPRFSIDNVRVTSFPVPTAPVLQMGTATNVTETSITVRDMLILTNGGAPFSLLRLVVGDWMNPDFRRGDPYLELTQTNANVPFSATVSNNLTFTNLTTTNLISGTLYYLRLFAQNTTVADYGATGDLQVWTLPPAPVFNGVSNNTTNGFLLNWGATRSATSYRLDVDDNSDFSSPVSSYNGATITATSTSAPVTNMVTGLAAGTQYFTRVRAVNPSGSGSNSTTLNAWTLPAAPTNVTATGVTTNAFSASWSAPLSAMGYRLDLDDNSDFSSPVSGFDNLLVGSTNQALTGLSPGTQYYLRVRATNSGGTGPNSSTLLQWTIPSAPQDLSASSVSTNSFTAGWGATTGAASYRLDVDDSTDFSSPESGFNNLTVSGTSQSVTGLAAGTEYYFRVRAVNPGGTSVSSTNFSQWMLPAAPANLAVSGVSTNGFTVTWSATLSATSYRLDVDDNASFSTPESAYNDLTVNGTSQVVSGLFPGTTYYVRVRAVNPAGTGPASTSTQDTTAEESSPTRTLNIGGTLGNFSTIFGTASAAQSFTVSGEDLSSTPLRVEPPAGYEVSLTSDFAGTVGTNGSPLSLGTESTVNAIVFIRLAATTPVGSAYTGNIVVRGGGATQQTLSIPGGIVEPDVPGAPTLGTIAAGPNQLSVAFTPPAYDGGSAITNYEYSLDNGATFLTASPALTSSPLVITGLSSATTYTVRLRAVNAAGNGPASSSGTGTPTTPPGGSLVLGGTNITFGSGLNSFTMEFVPVANPGNPANVSVVTNVTGNPMAGFVTNITTNVVGAVPYSFRMAKFEVTRGMVLAVNSAGVMNLTLRASPPGGTGTNQPAMGISWNMAARFVNWLNTNQGHSPAYKFSRAASLMDGNDDNIQLWTTNDEGFNPANPFRNTKAVYVLPSEDEWYKAAFHGGTNKYWLYPTAQDTAPTPVTSGTNGAVYSTNFTMPLANPAAVNLAGGPSFYGTVGQGGNVLEMTESSLSRTNNSATNGRIQYGGDWTSSAAILANNFRSTFAVPPTNSASYNNVGFRVAQILPVPSAPTIVSITPGDGQLSVAFTPPSSDGGETISNYEYSTDGGLTYTAFSPSQSTSPLIITGLVNGTTYPVRIKAVNSAGAGAASNSVSGTPVGSPALSLSGTLSAFGTTFGTESAAQSFTVSGSNLNGTDVTLRPPVGYELSLSENFSGTVGTSGSPLNLGTGTSIGSTPVYVRLAATATGGSSYRGNITLSGGGATTRSLAITSGTVNRAVATGPTGSISVGNVTVGGTSAATGVGGSGTGVYQYRIKDSVTGVVTLASNGAISAVGAGTVEIEVRRLGDQNYEDSAWVSAGTVTVASAPSSPSLTVSSLQLPASLEPGGTFTATFIEPSAVQYILVGGSDLNGTAVTVTPPTGYEVSLNQEFTGTVGTSSSPLNLGTGTSIGTTTVYVRLAAGTPVGSGYTGNITVSGGGATAETAAISSGTVTAVPPGAPTIGEVTNGDSQLTVAFTPPTNNGGLTITNYEYQLNSLAPFTPISPADTTSPLVITGLTNGTSYDVSIRAVNAVGAGLASETRSGIVGGITGGTPSFAGASFTFGNGTNTFPMSFVAVDNPGNPADPLVNYSLPEETTNFFGAVAYRYRMGTFEVSRGQVAAANAAGGLVLTLSTNMPGGTGTNQPAAGLSWNMMARFVNWMNTNRGYPPAYKFSVQPGQPGYNANANIEMWTTNDPGYDPANPFRNTNASFVLPNDAEWYKAAYHGGGTKYWLFPTAQDSIPTAVRFGTNGAVFSTEPAPPSGPVNTNVTRTNPAAVHLAGGPSFYGTVGQGGNMYEVLENSAGNINNSPTNQRTVRGGSWTSGHMNLRKDYDVLPLPPNVGDNILGFRVAQARMTPSAPTITTITPGTNQYSVAFTPPISDGGDAITSYEYSLDGGSFTAFSPAGTTSPLVITNLTGGTTYTVAIRAVNPWGAGLVSEPVSGGPVIAAPSATPSLTLGSLSGGGTFTASFGTNSAAQSFTVSGSDLDGTPVTVTPPAGYEVSLDENFGTSSTSLNLGTGASINTTVYVRLASGNPVATSYTGNITVSGGGVSDQTIAITGGTVNKGAQDALVASLSDNSLRIGESGSVIASGGSGSGEYEYQVKGGGTNVVTITGGGAYLGRGVGTAEIEVRKLGDDTYETTAWLTVNDIITVSKALQAPVSGLLADLALKVGQATSVTASGGSGTGAYEYRVVGSGSSFVTVGSDGVITTISAGTAEIEVRRLGDATYEDSDWVSAGTVTVNALSPLLGVVGSLNSFSTTVGTASAAQSFMVDGADLNGVAVTVTPPEGYEVSLTSDFATVGTNGSPLTLSTSTSISPTPVYVRLRATAPAGTTYSGEILVSGGGATAQRVNIPGGTVSAEPSLTLGSWSGGGNFTAAYGTNSVAQSFTLTGSNLDPVNFVYVTPPVGYEVSLDPTFAGTVGTTGAALQVGTVTGEISAPIYVRLSSNNPVGATYTGNITVSGGGVSSDRTIAVTGEVTKAAQAPLVANLNKNTLLIGEGSSVSVSGGSGFGDYEYRILDETSDVVSLTGGGFYSGAGVGSKAVQVRRTGDANYLDTDWVTVGTVTVSKAPQTAVTGFLSDVSVEVGQTAYVIGDGGSGAGLYEYRIKDDVTGVVTLGEDGTITTVGTGSVVIEVRKLGDSTYEDSGWVVAGTLTVTAPASSILAANDTVDRDGIPGSMTSILIANLLTNDTYARPGAPTVTLPSGTTAQGGTVMIDNGWILYTSAGNLAASDTDSFTYQIDDGTGTSTATVTLVAGDYSATAVNIVWVKNANSPQTGKDVNFAVTPNRYYRIYATSSLTAPISWQDLGHGSVYGGGLSGSIIINDPGAGSSRFYKLEEYRP